MSTDEQQRRGGFVPDRRAGRHAAWHRPAREGHDGANPAPLHDAPTGEPAQARPVATARRRAAASIAPPTAAAYLAHVFESGRAASTAAQAVKAANFRAKLAGLPPSAGERTARVMAGLPPHGRPTGAGGRPRR